MQLFQQPPKQTPRSAAFRLEQCNVSLLLKKQEKAVKSSYLVITPHETKQGGRDGGEITSAPTIAYLHTCAVLTN